MKKLNVKLLLFSGLILLGLAFGMKYFATGSKPKNNKIKTTSPGLSFFLNKFPNIKNLLGDKNKSEVPLYLNAIVYSYCRSERREPAATTLDELYFDCKTACGGYSYILIDLLKHFGFQAKYLNFYNMPNQGNHTAVIVKLEGKWVLLDPTYGSYFMDKNLMSFEDVYYIKDAKTLEKYTYTQAKKRDKDLIKNIENIGLDELYSLGHFKHKFMSLNNYLVSEQVSPLTNNLLPLTMPLDMRTGYASFGKLGATNSAEIDSAFLKQTNDTLNDSDPNNDISFRFKNMGRVYPFFRALNTLILKNLSPRKEYTLRVTYIQKTADPSELSFIKIGKSIKLKKSDTYTSPSNPKIHQSYIHFYSKTNFATISYTLENSNESAELVALEVCPNKLDQRNYSSEKLCESKTLEKL